MNVGAFRDEHAARRYRFTRVAIAGAPEEAGVYALWDGDEVIYYGRADGRKQGGGSTIRSRLLAAPSRSRSSLAFGFIGMLPLEQPAYPGFVEHRRYLSHCSTKTGVPFAGNSRGEQAMSIKSQSLPFTPSLIEAAPDTVGVFALWQDGGVIYLGKASGGSATIRKALAEQLRARQWSSHAGLRCSWEVADDPDRRHSELLREFEAAHHCAPLWNDPRRLPT
jgi:hypothetical protein